MTQEQNTVEEGFRALSSGDSEQALEIGSGLIDSGHVRGFEIKAFALEQQGKMEEALELLRSVLSKEPKIYPLWELLGNMCSKEGLFAEAEEAYQKALACPDADNQSIAYNRAVMMSSSGQLDKALELVEQVTATKLFNRVRLLKTFILNGMGRFDQVPSICNQLIADIFSKEELSELDMKELSQGYAELGRMAFFGHDDRQSAFNHAWKSLEWDRSSPSALWLLRELLGRTSDDCHFFRLSIIGTWHSPLKEGEMPPQFVTEYEVVADSVEESFLLAQSLEPLEVRESMLVHDVEDLGLCAQYGHGVYWRSQYEFSPVEGE